ncbi:EAL domain-containing protein [Benzoatithermus flavus]|uniref:EAL domain-containing protein n=1 Tax=Benzoatithermus flavus TaxID=3108223 RepID=A0ABU8XLZ8_9PROT
MAKIAVIDDRVTNRNILTRLAASVEEGLSVHAFPSALTALEAFDGGLAPDLIVTDFNMPEMDGASFVRALRSRQVLVDVPIIVVTVYEDREFRYRALEAGATDFLLSPVDHLEFRARARNLLTLHRQQLLLAEKAADLERTLETQTNGPAEDRLQQILDAMPAAVSIVDAHGRIKLVNRGYERLLGIDRAAMLGRPLAESLGEDYALQSGVLDDKVLETGQPLACPTHETLVTPSGATRWLLTSKAPLGNGTGWVPDVLTVALDVTELRRAEASTALLQQEDALTGLPTAEHFRARFEHELARIRRQHEMLALIHLDLDRFKGINDAFGKEFGSELLREVACRLKARLGPGELLARVEGDEFLILQTGIKRPDDAGELARRLGEAFALPFVIRSHEVHLSASLGITVAPADGRTVEALLKNAELAMYRAKKAGRDAYRFFAAEMNLAARRAVTLERELRQALAGEQFVVHYQPQLDLRTGAIIGAEALVRWSHPYRGLVGPGEFIGLAEDIGLIAPLTAWVLRSACRQQRQWQDRGLGGLQMSVNLSPVQFRERGIEQLVERVLAECALPASSLDLELTENAVIENSQTAISSLRHLNQLGVSLSIDDFGTGYSSLSYIKRLPVRRLKIDRSFVQNLEHSPNDEVIVRAIINLGHSLGLRVIAEGVETKGQLSLLHRFDCDEVQGHLVSPPLSPQELERKVLLRAAARPAESLLVPGPADG